MSIYFQDESSFEMNQKVGRVLCSSGNKPIRKNGKEKRHEGLSVSGVRRTDGKFYYKTSRSKKGNDFLSFVYKLRAKEKNERMILIVDNARIHHTKKLKEYCNQRKIILVYLPPYSPDLNPIERLWKILKREYRKIQWKHEDIKDGVKAASKLIKSKISGINIENLINTY